MSDLMNRGDVFEGKYRIIRELGVGGFATVYLAEHMQIEQRVAIKVLLEGGTDERFLREGKILAKLTSPSTVRILDFGQTEAAHAYMISEFVEGDTLEEILKRRPLGAEEVLPIVEQVLESLSEAHAQGIIHRDIKPANIMRLPTGQVKVLDFGIAQLEGPANAGGLTASGIVLGTPRYLSPERILSGQAVGPSADIFALGLVAYALLTGGDANTGESSAAIVERHLSAEPYSLPPDIDLPAQLRVWVDIATKKVAAERYGDATIALDALRSNTANLSGAPREIELDLGDGEFLAVGLDTSVPRSSSPASNVPGRRDTRIRTVDSRPWSMLIAVGLVVVLAAGVAAIVTGTVRLDVLSRVFADPTVAIEEPADSTEVSEAYAAGKAAFEERNWIEALRHFLKVAAHKQTHAAQDLARRGYIDRAIASVLETAVDDREEARTKEQLRDAALGPRQVLELFPEHDDAKSVLQSIADAEERGLRKRGTKSAPTVKIGGVP